jgi:hypothetical protein
MMFMCFEIMNMKEGFEICFNVFFMPVAVVI